MKKRHLKNCWKCRHNRTTETGLDGEEHPCTPWCQPYQDEWLEDDTEVSPDGIITWTVKVGLDDENMPPRKTLIGCPKWARK